MSATEQGKDHALSELAIRRTESAKEKKIDNSTLYAGSPMYFYCKSCGVNHVTLPESYLFPPPALCGECRALKDCGWLD